MKIIAIDISISANDSKKCGICIYNDIVNKIETYYSMSYEDLLKYTANNLIRSISKLEKNNIKLIYPDDGKTLIIFEDSNLSKSNWHGCSGMGNVGKNKAACMIFHKWLELHKITYQQLPPNGYSQLFKNRKFCKEITGIDEKNADVRSAIAMIYKNYEVTK